MSTWTVKLDSHEDGVGLGWSYEQALLHIRRCEFDEREIKYTLVEHEEEIDSLQPTEPKRRGRKSSIESPDE